LIGGRIMEVFGLVSFKRYRDKVNGNNYFSGKIFISIDGVDQPNCIIMEFQYSDEPHIIAKEQLQLIYLDAKITVAKANLGFVNMKECKQYVK